MHARVAIAGDADIVAARKAAREMATRAGFGGTDLTIIATAVSEVTRNIVRFAGKGEVIVTIIDDPRPGLLVVAHDGGPGIADVEQALEDGYSTYNGLGLGLPDCISTDMTNRRRDRIRAGGEKVVAAGCRCRASG